MRIKLKDDRGASVRGSMRGVQLVIGRERELRRAVKRGLVPGYVPVHRAWLRGIGLYFLTSLGITIAWGVVWLWLMPRAIGRAPLLGEHSMISMFAQWFPAQSGRQVSALALVAIMAYLYGALLGGIVGFWPMYRRYVIPHAIRRTLLSRLCPACEFSLRDLQSHADGCTVCPECGAAWRIPEGAMAPEPLVPTPPQS